MRCVTMISAVLSRPLHHGVTVWHDRKYRQGVQAHTHKQILIVETEILEPSLHHISEVNSLQVSLLLSLHSWALERVQVPLCGWKLPLQVKQAHHIPQMGLVVKPGVPSGAQKRGLMLYFDWIVSHIESSHYFERQLSSRQDKHQNRPPNST